MPELPDVLLYLHALKPRVVGHTLERLRITSPFVLRSVTPPVQVIEGQVVTGLRRLGKRIVFEFPGDCFLVVHLMIAGRFRWKPAGAPVPGKLGLAAFDFENGTLLLTEAGSRKRASMHVVSSAAGLTEHDRGGIDVMATSRDGFARALASENHTLKRALTDPRLLSGIGNAYSDEILHAARLSPLKLTSSLAVEEVTRLYDATQSTLTRWTERLQSEAAEQFPDKVTAFRPGMAVHGQYGQACPTCGSPIQRIVYAANECNYCAQCQTGGRLLADRALSRLLKTDWPRTLDELERRHR